MPLSKARNRDRMREIRLHAKKDIGVVQPKTIRIEGKNYIVPELDADGNLIYED